jgi:hypothetical protein
LKSSWTNNNNLVNGRKFSVNGQNTAANLGCRFVKKSIKRHKKLRVRLKNLLPLYGKRRTGVCLFKKKSVNRKAKLRERMKNLPPLYGKIFTENLVIYGFEPQSQMIYYGLFRDFLKQCTSFPTRTSPCIFFGSEWHRWNHHDHEM